MDREKLLKEALERLGIHTQKELKEAIGKTIVNISVMAAGQPMPGKAVGL